MANRTSYIEFLIEQLSPLGEITARRLFGGHSLYCNGTVFALVARDTLYLKVDDQTRPEFAALGLETFHPFGDARHSMQYYQAPAELFEHSDAVHLWGGRAVAAGRRAARKR